MFPDETKNIFTDQYNLEQELSRKIMLLSPVQALNEMFSGTIEMTAWGKLYKTELFKDIRYPKDTMYEDWATIYKLIGKADRIVSTHKKLYGYRIRKGSLTQTGLRPGMLVIFNICDEINEYLQKQYPECLEAFAYRRAQASMMMMDRIIAGKSSAEHYDMLKQCKQRVRVDLKPVLFNSKVKLLYKVGPAE